MTPIWTPSQATVDAQAITEFSRRASELSGRDLSDYEALYQWSIDETESFWTLVWDFCGVIAESRGERVLVDGDMMPGAVWFPDARLNFAQNLLRRKDDELAIIFRGEDDVEASVSWGELHQLVSQTQQLLRDAGVVAGDRVAGYMPNMPETVIAMLATVSLGAVWTSCSPDYGVQGIVDRFSQTAPKVLFTADGYIYNGKNHDSLEKVAEMLEQLPSIEKVYVCGYVQDEPRIPNKLLHAVLYSHALMAYGPKPIEFVQMPFNAPLSIMYSSGTTGAPKCIVHGAGGVLLQHLKEHVLHIGLKPTERIFYFTNCGWMMWNWLVSALAAEATVVLYDGSPFFPDANALFQFAEEVEINVFGTSAKFIDATAKSGVRPVRDCKLGPLRMVLSTSSPLSPECYDYVYTHIKHDVCLSSIAGGTDLLSNFALGNMALPVNRGELQCRGLGMAVEVWDENGQSLSQQKGELVCTKPFPSMPISFWNDADGSNYRHTYFEKYPGVWHQGDYVELTENNGLVYYGRSDATLNPGGVRIGTSEIYRQVEQLDEVIESLVIGHEWRHDTRMVLFVKLAQGLSLDDALTEKIKLQIRENTTHQHVPAKVVQVSDIPRTKSGKITELAVRDTVHGSEVSNLDALANPEVLAEYENRIELRT